jgi:hypothetical protein
VAQDQAGPLCAFLQVELPALPPANAVQLCLQARMSAQGIPQIAGVLGCCTAGGADMPVMADMSTHNL